MSKNVKIVFGVPLTDADKLRQAMSEAGIGKIGNYDSCSFSSRGIGRFRPLKDSNPSIGNIGEIEEVEEERIETICPRNKLSEALEVIKKAHPYEVPAIDVYPLEDIE
jgi:hypothetical protein